MRYLVVVLAAAVSFLTSMFVVKGMAFDREASEAKARATVVMLRGPTGNGSGVVLAPGVIVTAKHVATTGDLCVVTGSECTPATLAWASDVDDIAVMRADVVCPCASKIAAPKIDEKVLVIGYPYGNELNAQVLTRGEYQGGATVEGFEYELTTASAASGNSGGGVFVVRDGEVYLVGVLTNASTEGDLSLYVSVAKKTGGA